MQEKRLIDANAAIKAMNAVDMHFWEDAEDGVEKCVNILYNMPAADAALVRHGRWVKLGKHDWACSVCKMGVPYSYTGHNYCPNCGATMDGGINK